MTDNEKFELLPIGYVRSTLKTRKEAPKQANEGAPAAWVEINPAYAAALDGLAPGDNVILLTWLHQSTRDVLRVHPRHLPDNEICGVFATRSPDRPNPVGLHPVRILDIADNLRLRVEPLEAIDGTPVIDIKPARC